MKIQADLSLCDGYANCVLADDDVFDLDESSKVMVLIAEPDEAHHEAVEEAVRNCPVNALILSEV